ncbi:YdeI family protein [Nanoarchaeota archaeon]
MENKENRIDVFDIKDFENWLKKNHEKEKNVTIIIHKKHTGKSAPSHRQQIEMAICFGWIDTTVKRNNEDTYLRKFVKRNKNSTWSNNTIGYAKDLIKQGKMTPQGMHFYKLGLSKPTNDHGIPKNPEIPLVLKKALEKNKKAKNNFEKLTPSTKKMIYRWLLRAKLQKTINKRVNIILDSAMNGKKIF